MQSSRSTALEDSSQMSSCVARFSPQFPGEPKLMVSVNEGGQAAFVNHLTQNGADKDKSDSTKSPPLVADQSGTVMPIIEPDDQSVTTVPRIEQNEQPAPSATRRRRRA